MSSCVMQVITGYISSPIDLRTSISISGNRSRDTRPYCRSAVMQADVRSSVRLRAYVAVRKSMLPAQIHTRAGLMNRRGLC